MDVWIKRVRKQAKCKYCEQPIVKDTYMVVCKIWYTRNKDGISPTRWVWWMRFHTQCWIDQAVQKLDREEEQRVETRGRKRQGISDDMRSERVKILRRYAAITQRIRAEVVRPADENSVERLIHLGAGLNKMRIEIERYGGVPKSWEK